MSTEKCDRTDSAQIILKIHLPNASLRTTILMESSLPKASHDTTTKTTAPCSDPSPVAVSGSQLAQLPPQTKCTVDAFHHGFCKANVMDDDRQGISHFFGRNKSQTATIARSLYPLVCRVHYQEKSFRSKDIGHFADLQCAHIVIVLKNMAEKTWTDEHGNTWPWFCGLTLQLCQPSKSKSALKQSCKVGNKVSRTFKETRTHDDESDTDNNDDDSGPVPEWLLKLCTKNPESDMRYEDEDANGVQYNIPQMIMIVRAIGKWCSENGVKIPPIEALPETLGTHFAMKKIQAKDCRDDAERDVRIAEIKLRKFKSSRSSDPRKVLSEELDTARRKLAFAEEDFRLATLDCDPVQHMIPAKRITKPRSLREPVRLAVSKVKSSDHRGLTRNSGMESLSTAHSSLTNPDGKNNSINSDISPQTLSEYLQSKDCQQPCQTLKRSSPSTDEALNDRRAKKPRQY